VVACWIRQHQRWSGKAGPVLLKPAIKWSFQVPMAFLSAFVQCRCGGTSW
jgi:hypothetical protein